MTNAVQHALPPVAMSLRRTAGDVRLEVSDGGPAPQRGEWAAGCDEEEHGSRADAHGITHWADLFPAGGDAPDGNDCGSHTSG